MIKIQFLLKFLARFGLSSSIPYVVILFIEEKNIKFHIILSLKREFQAVFHLEDKNTHCIYIKIQSNLCQQKTNSFSSDIHGDFYSNWRKHSNSTLFLNFIKHFCNWSQNLQKQTQSKMFICSVPCQICASVATLHSEKLEWYLLCSPL